MLWLYRIFISGALLTHTFADDLQRKLISGLELLNSGDLSAASILFHEALIIDPKNFDAVHGLAHVYWRNHEWNVS